MHITYLCQTDSYHKTRMKAKEQRFGIIATSYIVIKSLLRGGGDKSYTKQYSATHCPI